MKLDFTVLQNRIASVETEGSTQEQYELRKLLNDLDITFSKTSMICGDLKLPLASRNVAWDSGAADTAVRKFVGADDKPNEEYSKAFLAKEGDGAEFSDYHFPFATIIGGKLTAVPKAVFAIAASLDGARGGSDVEDQEACKTAVGTLYKRMAREFKDPSITVPWSKGKSKMTAEFTAGETNAEFRKKVIDPEFGPSWLYENSLLFKVGDYPDKDFSLSDEEAAKAVRTYEGGAKLNYAHCPYEGPLDGRFGIVRDICKDGEFVKGSVVVPDWLDNVLPKNEPKKVSCEWDRETKTLTGLALVTNPRVEEAALYAAFSDDAEAKKIKDVLMSTKYEDNPMQKAHDLAAMCGAECNGQSQFSTAEFITPELLKAVQHIHDHAAKFGASCDAFATRQKSGMLPAHYFNDGKEKPMDDAKFAEETAAFQSKIKEYDAQFAALKAEKEASEKAAEADKAEFSQKIVAITAELEATKTASQFTADKAHIEKLVSEFKLTPAESAKYEELAKNKPAVFAEMRELLDARPAYVQHTGSTVAGKTVASKFDSDADPYELLKAETETIMQRDKVSYTEAFTRASKKNPEASAAMAAAMSARR